MRAATVAGRLDTEMSNLDECLTSTPRSGFSVRHFTLVRRFGCLTSNPHSTPINTGYSNIVRRLDRLDMSFWKAGWFGKYCPVEEGKAIGVSNRLTCLTSGRSSLPRPRRRATKKRGFGRDL